jgi:hypothetical protein
MSALMPRRRLLALVAASLIFATPAAAEPPGVATLDAMFATLQGCWRPPPLPPGHPGFEITVLVSFQRDGAILGKPKITFETPDASAEESLAYRVAVMETLQRCTPLPFTGGLGDAVAGRPFRLRFDNRRAHPKPIEKRAWLTTTTL